MLHFEPVKSYRSTLTADSSAHSPDDVELPQQSRSPHLRLNMAFISDQERMSLSDSQSISEDRSISAISRRDHNRNLCHFREELSDVE